MHRVMVLFTAKRWGYDNPLLQYSKRIRICRAAATQVAYDNGYPKMLSYNQVSIWISKVNNLIDNGKQNKDGDVLKSSHIGSITYVTKIETNHPGYLHQLYRYASKTIGSKSGFAYLALCMNGKSAIFSENRCNVYLSKDQLMDWFVSNNGKEYSPKEKPLDTPVHCTLRLKWVRIHHFKLNNPFTPVAHLDEKFFYTTNRRRKIKVLPPGPLESESDALFIMPKMLSRRFPIKAMFMGVVGRPIPHRNFNGKIFLERVSERIPVSKITSHQNFTDDCDHKSSYQKLGMENTI